MTLIKPHDVARLLVAGGLALGIAAGAVAQPGGHHSHRMGMHMRGLQLTEAQRDRIFKIRHEQAPALRERMKAARSAREELRTLARVPRFDAARARVAAEAAGKAMADVAYMRAETKNRIRELLTDEQRAKLDKMRSHRGSDRDPAA